MGMTPGSKAALMEHLMIWQVSHCPVSATLVTLTPVQCRAQGSAAAKSVPGHAGTAELMGEELACVQS